jgi:hypothetical protein
VGCSTSPSWFVGDYSGAHRVLIEKPLPEARTVTTAEAFIGALSMA